MSNPYPSGGSPGKHDPKGQPGGGDSTPSKKGPQDPDNAPHKPSDNPAPTRDPQSPGKE